MQNSQKYRLNRNAKKGFDNREMNKNHPPDKEEELHSELRYLFLFNEPNLLRKSIIKLSRKYKANICVSEFIKSINEYNLSKSKQNISLSDRMERRKKMKDYADTIVTSLRRDWEIKKLLKE